MALCAIVLRRLQNYMILIKSPTDKGVVSFE